MPAQSPATTPRLLRVLWHVRTLCRLGLQTPFVELPHSKTCLKRCSHRPLNLPGCGVETPLAQVLLAIMIRIYRMQVEHRCPSLASMSGENSPDPQTA